MVSSDYADGNELSSLRAHLTRARNTILSLRQRTSDVEKEKRENGARIARLAQFEREPPTYDEFCAFISELNAGRLATSNAAAATSSNSLASSANMPPILPPAADAEASRTSPSHSESSQSMSVQGSCEQADRRLKVRTSNRLRSICFCSF